MHKAIEGESGLPNQCGVLGSQVDRVQKPGLASAVDRVERAIYEHQGVRLNVDCPRNLGNLSDDSDFRVNCQKPVAKKIDCRPGRSIKKSISGLKKL